MTDKPSNFIQINKIRKAIANYMSNEGCSCCRGDNYNKYKKKLAKLLNVEMYDDKSGYDFYKYKTRRKSENND